MVNKISTAEEVKQHPAFREALVSLLYQLADDNFILSFRGSEWLGLAPQLESDVAFSSIWQDHMGHAALFYRMLEELGEGRADDLAHLRTPHEMRNAILTERSNGLGDYIVNPRYDWAYAVVRQFIFDLFESVRMTSLQQSSYLPLAQAAAKVAREKPYHVLHGESWLGQMIKTEEGQVRLKKALTNVWHDLGDLFSLGEMGEKMVEYGLTESEDFLRKRFVDRLRKVFDTYNINWPGELPKQMELNGRLGEHTDELAQALDILSEVYRQDPAANW